MKKIYLLLIGITATLFSVGQPVADNVDIKLFYPGANGSNPNLGAYVEVALRIKPTGVGYNPTPVAEDYAVYLIAPKTDFDLTDAVVITEVNSALYSTASTSAMLDAGVLDIGLNDPNNYYFPIVLNSSGLNLSSLSPVSNDWVYSFTFKFNNVKTAAQFNKLVIVDNVNNSGLSTYVGGTVRSALTMSTVNQLTNVALSILPVSIINFSGYKSGSKNALQWATSSEQNNLGFEVQRSSEGSNYNTIGFVNSKASGGNSATELNYSFDDNSPLAAKKSYYRLRQVDADSRSRFSNTIVISSDKPKIIGIAGLFPNPANDVVNVLIDAPSRQDITLVLMDLTGKTIRQKTINVETGSNTVPVEINQLANGSYFVKIISHASAGESAVSKFIKQ